MGHIYSIFIVITCLVADAAYGSYPNYWKSFSELTQSRIIEEVQFTFDQQMDEANQDDPYSRGSLMMDFNELTNRSSLYEESHIASFICVLIEDAHIIRHLTPEQFHQHMKTKIPCISGQSITIFRFALKEMNLIGFHSNHHSPCGLYIEGEALRLYVNKKNKRRFNEDIKLRQEKVKKNHKRSEKPQDAYIPPIFKKPRDRITPKPYEDKDHTHKLFTQQAIQHFDQGKITRKNLNRDFLAYGMPYMHHMTRSGTLAYDNASFVRAYGEQILNQMAEKNTNIDIYEQSMDLYKFLMGINNRLLCMEDYFDAE